MYLYGKNMDLATFCIGIHDHRIDRCKHHSVGTIMFVSLVGVFCGAETWEEIVAFYSPHESFLLTIFLIFKVSFLMIL